MAHSAHVWAHEWQAQTWSNALRQHSKIKMSTVKSVVRSRILNFQKMFIIPIDLIREQMLSLPQENCNTKTWPISLMSNKSHDFFCIILDYLFWLAWEKKTAKRHRKYNVLKPTSKTPGSQCLTPRKRASKMCRFRFPGHAFKQPILSLSSSYCNEGSLDGHKTIYSIKNNHLKPGVLCKWLWPLIVSGWNTVILGEATCSVFSAQWSGSKR